MPNLQTDSHTSKPTFSIAKEPLRTLAALVSGTLLIGSLGSTLHAAELDYIEVGAMYMAYFDLNTSNGELLWTNKSDYALDGPQVLRPLSVTNPEDHYASTVPAAGLLNPHANGGADAASSRLFGFSLTGDLRSYLTSNGYAFAIQLDSITYAGTTTAADSVSVFYYNRGNDDWGSYHADKAEWSELTHDNYLIWNGQSFSNMIHPLVVSLDDFPAEYTLTYSLSIIEDATGANVNATVTDTVTEILGIEGLSFSYTAQSLGAPPVPEPAATAAALATAVLALAAIRRHRYQHRHQRRQHNAA